MYSINTGLLANNLTSFPDPVHKILGDLQTGGLFNLSESWPLVRLLTNIKMDYYLNIGFSLCPLQLTQQFFVSILYWIFI